MNKRISRQLFRSALRRGLWRGALLACCMSLGAAVGALEPMQAEPEVDIQPLGNPWVGRLAETVPPLDLDPRNGDVREDQGLRAHPNQATFRTPGAVARVRLTLDGRTVPADEVQSMRALVNGSDYSRMFQMGPDPDQPDIIRIAGRPETLEVGTYNIHIRAAGGETVVRVHAPLDELPDTLENRAAQLGISVRELRERLGLIDQSPRGYIRINLPPQLREGRILRLAIGERPGRHFTWRLNGETVLEGMDESTLLQPLTELGHHTLSVEERVNGLLAASWEGGFEVTPEPELEWSVPVGVEVSVSGPEGFESYAWRVNGQPVGQGPVLRHTFETPGVYRIECRAEAPTADDSWAYRRIVWRTEAR